MARTAMRGPHDGENWPYHWRESTGEMVPCASNPCSKHKSGDIIAISLENATEIYYENAPATGLGSPTPTSSPLSKGEEVEYVKRQRNLLASRLAPYAPKDWKGPDLERINGGQFSEWQGRDYERLNNHLDAVDADARITETIDNEYKAFVAIRVAAGRDGLQDGGFADTLPVRFLLSPEAERAEVVSMSANTPPGQSQTILESGLHRGSVQSKAVIDMTMGDGPRKVIGLDDVIRLEDNPDNIGALGLFREAQTAPWGELAFSIDADAAQESGKRLDPADVIRDVGAMHRAVESSNGAGWALTADDYRRFGGSANAPLIVSALHADVDSDYKASPVDIRVLRKEREAETFRLSPDRTSPSEFYESDAHAPFENMRRRSLSPKRSDTKGDRRYIDRKLRRAAIAVRARAAANRMEPGTTTDRVYDALLRDPDSIHDFIRSTPIEGATLIEEIENHTKDNGR